MRWKTGLLLALLLSALTIVTACGGGGGGGGGDTSKSASLTVVINAAPLGTYFTQAPEVVWYKNNSNDSSEFTSKYPPISVNKVVTYDTGQKPTYKATVNIRNGFGVVTSSKTANFYDIELYSSQTITLVFY